jgi:hypothetical protein
MERLRRWTDWYEFARDTLDYERGEAEAYARIRYAEELNRQKLALERRRATAPTAKGTLGARFA